MECEIIGAIGYSLLFLAMCWIFWRGMIISEYRRKFRIMRGEIRRLRSHRPEFDLLYQCYQSGQIPERQWQEHLKDDRLKKWLEYSNN